MSKYLYPIYKLKTKSYIRWWLYNYLGKFNNYVLSEILTGTSFYLEDSTDRKFNIFDMIGRTTQDGDPTPENPVPIKNTGDNGSVNEKVQNKNLFDENKILLPDGIYTKIDDEIRISNGVRDFYAIKFKENTSYTISYDIKNSEGGNGRLAFYYTDGTTEDCGLNNTDSYKHATKTSNSSKTLQKIKTTFGSGGLFYLKNIQLEQGSTATDYTAHAEQNISFPLAQGQKLMEGDYLADDGVVNLWNEDTVNGTTATFTDAKTNGRYYCNQKVSGTLTGQTITFDTSVTNAIVQYELANPITTPYTEEQQTAWEEIKRLRTYKPVTHISSEDETPAELKIQYYKEV